MNKKFNRETVIKAIICAACIAIAAVAVVLIVKAAVFVASAIWPLVKTALVVGLNYFVWIGIPRKIIKWLKQPGSTASKKQKEN